MTPKFYPGTGKAPLLDWSSRDNAKRLAMVIKKRWKNCGYNVNIRVILTVNHNQFETNSKAYYGVVSDLVNGLPRDYRRLN